MSFTDRAERYLFNNRYFLLYCLGISFLAFGFEIFNVAISIDEEAASNSPQPMRVWLQMDRWGMFVLNWLLQSGPPLPYFNMLLGMMANLAAFFLCLKIWVAKGEGGRYLAAIFVLAHPTLAFVYAFNQSQYGYFIGLFLAILGVYYFIGSLSTLKRFLITSTCWILALSIYQSVIFAAPTVYFIYLVSRNVTRTLVENSLLARLRGVFVFCSLLLLSVLMHELLSGFIRNYFGNPGRYHTIEQFYAGSFLSDYDPLFVLREVVAQLIGHRWYVGYATGLTFLFSVYVLIRAIWTSSKTDKWQNLATFFFLVAAIISPFIFVILTADFWPARTMMALPVMMGGLVYVSANFFKRLWRNIFLATVGCCFFVFVHSNTKLFYSDYVSWQNDKLLANRIVTIIEMKYGDLLEKKSVPIKFVGTPERGDLGIRVREETFGGSLFSWDNGKGTRSLSLLKLIDVDYFESANAKSIEKLAPTIDAMPSWPANGSISMQEGIVIVKFSDEN